MTPDSAQSKLSKLEFNTDFVDSLTTDSNKDNYCLQVENACFSYVTPLKFPQASLIAYSKELAEKIGQDPKAMLTKAIYSNSKWSTASFYQT